MHNDCVHADDGFAHLAREHPEAKIDMAFLMRIIPYVSNSSRFPARALWPAVGTSLSPVDSIAGASRVASLSARALQPDRNPPGRATG